MSDYPPHPEVDLLAEVGRLCAAWSFFEMATERTLWGLLGVDNRIGPLITDRMDIRSRWAAIIRHASVVHDDVSMDYLRTINKQVPAVTEDRNIIVHGLINALPGETHLCATIFRGANANKRFPITTNAIRTIRKRIQALGETPSSLRTPTTTFTTIR